MITPSASRRLEHAAQRRPEQAAAIRGRVSMPSVGGYTPVRSDFRGDEIEVADDSDDADRARDLELSGRLGDVSALLVLPARGRSF